MTIDLIDVLRDWEGFSECKIHLASWNGSDNPLDVFVNDRAEWINWNRWRSVRDDFNRRYIFSLIDFYPEPGHWLFGGLFEVKERRDVRRDYGYEVELSTRFEHWIGRLKVKFQRPGRAKSLVFDNYCEKIEVVEVLRSSYDGEDFCGYDRINHSFERLEQIFTHSRPAWRTALENVKGVYLITDVNNGKRYVGSAVGIEGIWSRWNCYLGSGHGSNDELVKLIATKGRPYAQKHFRLTLLEQFSMKTEDALILERESFWKGVLLTRGDFGYNRN
jgi:hypothetical protein